MEHSLASCAACQEMHEPGWTSVAGNVESRVPELRGLARGMADSVDAWSEGTDAPFLRKIDMFQKQRRVKWSLPPNIVAGLAMLPMTAHPEYISGV